MTMTTKNALPDQLEIGKLYMVPTVQGVLNGRLDVWPVIGPMHEDGEIISFPWYHYHLDWRFFSRQQFMLVFRKLTQPVDRARALASTILVSYDDPLGPVVYRRRKCRREMPIHPEAELCSWLRNMKLPDAYQDHVLGADMICPHKGASLKGLPVDDGCVVCPLHGLRWNLQTRRLAHPKTFLWESLVDTYNKIV